MIIKDVTQLIGNTPILEIDSKIHNIENLNIYAKLELFNPFGSLKDRIAWGMIQNNLEDIKNNNKIVIESSSGNTSKALCILCSKENITFQNYTNRIKENNVREILQLLNCEIVEFPGVLECRPSNPNDRNDPKFIAMELENSNPQKYFYTKQYQNENNPNSQKKMGIEIIEDLEKVDYFFSFLGTGGSSRGVGEVLKKERSTSIIGVVSEEDEYIPGGRSLNEMWETGFFKKEFYDSINTCTINDAINGMLTLQQRCGLLVGPTGGATYQSVINFFNNKKIETPINIVFIACDRVEPYIDYIKKHRPNLFAQTSSKFSVSNLNLEEIEMYSKSQDLVKESNLIVDLRSSISFKLESIQNSINISYQQLCELVEEENIFKNFNEVLFVCTNSKSSKKISAFMNKKYNLNYSYLKGGFLEYKEKHLK
ncbi:MAG: pyridoxal-phosphate dependent enzyme [Nanoarchaeota archaeon]|nr:pyridoxal-phosphate dependent enzyme [Nanoarchaeota archaeon]